MAAPPVAKTQELTGNRKAVKKYQDGKKREAERIHTRHAEAYHKNAELKIMARDKKKKLDMLLNMFKKI